MGRIIRFLYCEAKRAKNLAAGAGVLCFMKLKGEKCSTAHLFYKGWKKMGGSFVFMAGRRKDYSKRSRSCATGV